ncbi:amidohydrolase family protein [Amycolatopsis cihanbeyliensis]|uniref:Putative TIM-barrel fold metal-dependent hydrolase n=1 Tax=Amycolatopsis cihanbeyliensis TaxID=1128664 RepID=A0A542DDU2_AMYCI|nr:amidohydrolase family protein [Amycolatopsis cihanbeyliensis]TQJ01232.1 putative TIM-barrel fold metal-dependent hydrolase [Amycolatopsis cihanbeyliensis]
MTGPVVDAHVRVGPGREVELDPATLLSTMDYLGIDKALVCPGERHIAVYNAEGNELTTTAAAASGGRLLAYAVANPWRGAAALTELARAREAGAVALALDPVLQGFDLLDGLADPLLAFAATSGWPVYVRTGTPPSALPLPLASLARRHPAVDFVMGRSGATDFWIDAAPALRYAPNLYADTSYAPWDTVLGGLAADPDIGTARLVFCTDSPYTVPAAELGKLREWPLEAPARDAVLGATVCALLRRRH